MRELTNQEKGKLQAASLAVGGGLLLYAWKQTNPKSFPVLRTAGIGVGALSAVVGGYALGLSYGVLPGA